MEKYRLKTAYDNEEGNNILRIASFLIDNGHKSFIKESG